MTEKSFGCLGVTDDAGKLIRVITDGDLRRNMALDMLNRVTSEIMTKDPVVVTRDELASTTLEIINDSSITSLFVTDDGTPVGIIHIHDLLRVGVV